MCSRERTVFLFSTHDISIAQGTTEAHYVSRYFATIFDTSIIAPTSSEIEGANHYSYSFSGLLGLLYINILLLPQLVWLAYNEQPDIVYVYRNVILPPLLIKFFFGSTLVTDLRVHPVNQPKEFNDDTVVNQLFAIGAQASHSVLLRFADVVITLSEPLRESLVDSFPVSNEDIVIVPLGVDPNVFEVNERKQDDQFTIAYMGSIKPHRGIELVIEALNELPTRHQRAVTIELFGPRVEHYVSDIEALADGGEYTVTWHGLIPHEAVPARVGQADCAVSPLPPHDGFEVSSPAKIYEYLALGLPIVATDITPHRRILSHEEDSLIVATDSPTEMASAIERLILDESFRATLSANARAAGQDNSWETRINTILDTIDEQTSTDITKRV
ncbi:glycosyltransferase [Halorubrum sp. SS5]|nr:glycosyltransferase [Halorubrum sp. SS5]